MNHRSRLAVTLSAAAVFAAAVAAGCGGSGDSSSRVPTQVVAQAKLVQTITAEGNLRAAESTPISPPRIPGFFEAMKLAWIAEDGLRVAKGDVVIRFDPTSLEQQLESNETSLASASAQLAKERIEGAKDAAKRDVLAELAEKELEKTKRFRERDSEIYSRNQIIEAEVNEGLSVARKEHAVAAKKIERGLSQSKATLAQVSKRQASLEIERAKAGLAGLEVRAPHDGLLVLKRNWRGELPRVGESVWPGQKVAEIPELSVMEAEIFVLEVDGGGLQKGTDVVLTIESVPGREFAGKIKQVDDIAKERVRGVPVQYFAAVVQLENTETAVMKPGGRVRARLDLFGSEGLVVPRSAVFVVDGKESVFVRGKDGFDAVAVELGSASAARVIVAEGLSAGDEIALADPRQKDDSEAGE